MFGTLFTEALGIPWLGLGMPRDIIFVMEQRLKRSLGELPSTQFTDGLGIPWGWVWGMPREISLGMENEI